MFRSLRGFDTETGNDPSELETMTGVSKRGPAGLKPKPPGYVEWLSELKTRIHTAQQRAVLAVNRELLLLYWELGRDILARQAQDGWGAGIVEQVLRDLRAASLR